MSTPYVTQAEGVFRLADSRVSLDSLVYLFREGMSPESMVECYPTLSLEEVYGAIAFYLANRETVDASMRDNEAVSERNYQEYLRTNADWVAKFRRARLANQVSS